jgi:hypothetical protein
MFSHINFPLNQNKFQILKETLVKFFAYEACHSIV